HDAAALALAEVGCGPAELEEALVALLERGVRASELAEDPAAQGRVAALGARLRDALSALRDAGGGALAFAPGGSKPGRVADAVAGALGAWPASVSRETLPALVSLLQERFPETLVAHVGEWGKQKLGVREREAFGSGAEAIARAAAVLAPLLEHAVAL